VETLGPAPLQSLAEAETELNRLREGEAMATRAVGAAEQAVEALVTLRQLKDQLQGDRQAMARTISRLRVLEKAFGRNGVQALLIEQGLPAIQDHANELLERLTAGGMRVRFSSQRQLKVKDALAETLEIHISDHAGERPYEMFSGGEAFRVNFAIRIALSQLLAQRAGARLQTLVIDEGFGSQDPEGRQRLVEVINSIQDRFAVILVITHIDELKDAFPIRIEVAKGVEGSVLSLN
jgi:exonuclease SbcC